MKSKKNLLEQLKPLPYFGKDVMGQLGHELGLKPDSLNVYSSRFLKSKEIIKLKKGLYVTADFFEKNRSEASYPFYLANILRKPSYVSSWAALQYYNLATEATYPITSVTPKVTRGYETKAGNFIYQSIRPDLFADYSLVSGKFDFYIASPAKALFDLLYFRTRQFRTVGKGELPSLIEELRIDFDEMDQLEQKKFHLMIDKIYERTNNRDSKKKN